jgi:hypothetical protein
VKSTSAREHQTQSQDRVLPHLSWHKAVPTFLVTDVALPLIPPSNKAPLAFRNPLVSISSQGNLVWNPRSCVGSYPGIIPGGEGSWPSSWAQVARRQLRCIGMSSAVAPSSQALQPWGQPAQQQKPPPSQTPREEGQDTHFPSQGIFLSANAGQLVQENLAQVGTQPDVVLGSSVLWITAVTPALL